MRTAHSVFVIPIVWILCSPLTAVAQTNSAAGAATPKKPSSTGEPSRQEQIVTLTKEVEDYQAALLNPDVASDANRTSQTKDLLINATCQLEALEMPPALTQDPKFVDGLLAACSDRLHGQAQQSGVTNGIAQPHPVGSPSVKTSAASNSTASNGTADYYIASGAVTDDTACASNPTNPGCAAGSISVPIPNSESAVACPTDTRNASVETPKLNAVNLGASSAVVSGTIAATANGKVQLCSDGKPLGSATPVTKGTFSVTFDSSSAFKLTNGQKILAQFTNQQGESGEPTAAVTVGSCKAAASTGTTPTLSVDPSDKSKVSFSGTVKGADSGYVRICVDDLPAGQPVEIVTGGKYAGSTSSISLKAGSNVTSQTCTGASCVAPFGPVSEIVPINGGPLVAGTAPLAGGPISILIGGVEYGGYSSEAQTTDAFLDIFYRGFLSKSTGLAGWTRIRLTSAAQPATNGVVSVISNPTGLTTVNYANVGQVFDYSVGPSWNLPKTPYWALIASLGAVTPLSSQNAPIVFVAPPPNTTECNTLLMRFSPQKGYSPGLTPGTATCVVNVSNPVTDIAFTNQDRSNFLFKYSGGFRTWYPLSSCKTAGSGSSCIPAYAAADFTLGQDESITGGLLRGVVFKMDGILPIPTGTSSWLYLFGSAYIRFRSNANLPPLILASPSSAVTVPSPNVAVLPLAQPNRDYYRLGVGVNINQLWCKVYASSCPTSTQASSTKNSVPSISALNPPTASAGSVNDLKNLTVTGTNFTSDSKINWDGTELSGTTFVSATELTVTVPKAKLAKATTVKVTVVNPSPSGSSAAYEFKIQ